MGPKREIRAHGSKAAGAVRSGRIHRPRHNNHISHAPGNIAGGGVP